MHAEHGPAPLLVDSYWGAQELLAGWQVSIPFFYHGYHTPVD
jgi:hypothetical protein